MTNEVTNQEKNIVNDGVSSVDFYFHELLRKASSKNSADTAFILPILKDISVLQL